MDNPELILQSLEHFPQLKDEEDYNIPLELEEYIHYVAKTGDPVFQWTLVKPLFREKIIKVVTDFFESNPGEIPDYPNVAKFNYEIMKETLLERIDWFKGAPFTIQRISELLVSPTKEYNRVDKYMRALEKNIYVVSTREPGMPTPVEENNSSFEESFIINGNDFQLKPDNNEDSEMKDDGEEDSALEMMKKCSNDDGDDPNFNIEVDVTNTTSEDAQEEEKLNSSESNEANVIPSTSESSTSESKCGQTRKLEDEEDGSEEIESKRFKMDDEAEIDCGDDEANDSNSVDPLENVNDDILEESDERQATSEELDNKEPDNDKEADVNSEADEKVNEVNKESEANVEIKCDKDENSGSPDIAKPCKEKEEDIEKQSTDLIAETSVETATKEVTDSTSSGDSGIEPVQDVSQDEELTPTIEATENVEAKSNDDMELEETIDKNIEESLNNQSESLLDVSESDSMVISQESASSSEENADKSIEKVEMIVSESSDMDLSDCVEKKEEEKGTPI